GRAPLSRGAHARSRPAARAGQAAGAAGAGARERGRGRAPARDGRPAGRRDGRRAYARDARPRALRRDPRDSRPLGLPRRRARVSWVLPEHGGRCFDMLPATVERLLGLGRDGLQLGSPLLQETYDRVALIYLDAFGW